MSERARCQPTDVRRLHGTHVGLLDGCARVSLFLRCAIALCVNTITSSFIHDVPNRSEEHTSELQSLMRISYAVFCLKQKKKIQNIQYNTINQHITYKTRIQNCPLQL